MTAQVQASVVDCVAALDQLHTTLTHELARRQQLELQVFDARTALAQVRAELAGTLGGHSQPLLWHDSVPSQSNASVFRTRVEQARAELHGPAHAVLYLHLDGFDPIKDTYGHDAADELMMIISARLTRALRAEDTVSRLRGGRFACLMVRMSSREQLSRLACKLFDAVAAPVKVGDARLSVRPSIGIAIGGAEDASSDALLKRAESAMDRAKRQKSGYAFCDESADAPVHGSD